jgi:WD40 repeat protein
LGETLRHAETVVSASFSPDGERVVTASEDQTARIWDGRTGQALGETLRHAGTVVSASFSPDCGRVVTASEDQTARIWDARTGQALGEALRHAGTVVSAGFSPDGERVVTASEDQTARIWDARTGQALGEALRHEGRLHSASFSPDGQRVVTASEDKTARVWDVRSLELPVPSWFPSLLETLSTACVKNNAIRPLPNPEGDLLDWCTKHNMPLPGFPEDLLLAQIDADRPSVPADGPGRPANRPDLPTRHVVAGHAQQPAKRSRGRELDAPSGLRRLWPETDRLAGLPGTGGQIRPVLFPTEIPEEPHNISLSESNEWTKVTYWFLSDRSTRTSSPFSAAPVGKHVQSLIASGTRASLREAVFIQPTNGLAYARLARRQWESTTNETERAQAEFLSKYALKLAPDLPEVWSTRLALLQEAGKSAEALSVASNATAHFPAIAEFSYMQGRLLVGTNRLEDAPVALTKTIELAGADEAGRRLRASALRERAGVYRQLGQQVEAERDFMAFHEIPSRPADCPPQLFDLTHCYNAGLAEDWHNAADVGNNLGSLPAGLQDFGGVRWDVRGIVQLDSVEIAKTAPGYPHQVAGVGVGRKCARLHFLHGAGWPGTNGTVVAKYIVHYADSSNAEIPVVYGRDLRNWQFWPEMADAETTGGTVAWRGPQVRWKDHYPDWGVRLYRLTWENPHPDKEIATLDLVSAMQGPAVFVIAITAEP